MDILSYIASRRSSAKGPRINAAIVNKNMRILVVDDSATMRAHTKDLLSDLGFNNIGEADDGRSALERLNAADIDFVITDSIMPSMSGIELIRAIRAVPDLADLPILMMMAEVGLGQLALGMRAGANGYLLKPCSAHELDQTIAQIFGPIDNVA